MSIVCGCETIVGFTESRDCTHGRSLILTGNDMNLNINKAIVIIGTLAFAAGSIVGAAFILWVLR